MKASAGVDGWAGLISAVSELLEYAPYKLEPSEL